MKVRFCFSAEQLKNIALVSMVIDHAAVGLLNSQNWLRALLESLWDSHAPCGACGFSSLCVYDRRGRSAYAGPEMVCAEAASAGGYFGDPL